MSRVLAPIGAALSLALGLASSPLQAAESPSARSAWALQLSGISHHLRDTLVPGRSWNERNWGIGLQVDVASTQNSRGVAVLSASTLRDSFGAWGGYAGLTIAHRWDLGRFEARAGAGPMLLYRARNWRHERHFVPAMAPVLSFEDKVSGLGVNALVVPKLGSIGGTSLVPLVFLQMTLRF